MCYILVWASSLEKNHFLFQMDIEQIFHLFNRLFRFSLKEKDWF